MMSTIFFGFHRMFTIDVTIHGPTVREQQHRGFIENSLREWNPLTPESFSYAANSRCLRLL